MKGFVLFSLFSLFSVPALADQSIHIDVARSGLYPAPISVYLQDLVPGVIQQALDAQCGPSVRVTDLNIQVQISHNLVPGAATLQLHGTAICQ